MDANDKTALLRFADQLELISTGSFAEKVLPKGKVSGKVADALRQRVQQVIPSDGMMVDAADLIRALVQEVESGDEANQQLNGLTWALSTLDDETVDAIKSSSKMALQAAVLAATNKQDERAQHLLKEAKAHMSSASKVLDNLGSLDPKDILIVLEGLQGS